MPSSASPAAGPSRNKAASPKSAKRKAPDGETSAPKKARSDKAVAAPARSTPTSSSQTPQTFKDGDEPASTSVPAQTATSSKPPRELKTSRTNKPPKASAQLPGGYSQGSHDELRHQDWKRGAEMETTVLLIASAKGTYARQISCRYPPDDLDPVLARTKHLGECTFCGATHRTIPQRCEKMREWTDALQLWQSEVATAAHTGRCAIKSGHACTMFPNEALEQVDPRENPPYNHCLPVRQIVRRLAGPEDADSRLRAECQELLFNYADGPDPMYPVPLVESDEQLIRRLGKYLQEADVELAEKDKMEVEQRRLRAQINELLSEYADGTELAKPASTPESDEQLVWRLQEHVDRADKELVEKDNIEAKHNQMRTEVNTLLSEFGDGPRPTQPELETDDKLLDRLTKYIERADVEWANKEKLEVELERANARIAELEHNYRLSHEDNDRLEEYNRKIVEKFDEVKAELRVQKDMVAFYQKEHGRAIVARDDRRCEYEVLSKEHEKLRHKYDLLELCCWRHGLVEHCDKGASIKSWTSVASGAQASPTVSANGAADPAS